MNTRLTLLAAACALALVACANKPSSSTAETTAPAPAATAAAPTSESASVSASASASTANEAPAETAAPAPATAEPAPEPAAATSAKPAAGAAGCATEIAATDTMQYNVKSITVPASCNEFKITLKHAGKLPVVAMGHNVVISKLADMAGVTTDGMAAGASNDYVKPGDPRVIAHTKLVGGGETTSVSFAVSKIKGAGPYEFFCSFPGHSAMMKGTIAVN